MENNQKMKFWSIVLLTINGIIGTGIFLSPGAVAKLVGDKVATIYLAAAVFAVSFAAASKYVVKSGAAYAYSKAAFGDEVGSYVGITRVVSASIAWGVFEAMAQEKHVPEFFTKRTKGGLPLTSFILTAGTAVIIPLAFNYNMAGIIIISSISRFIQFIIVPLAVITFFYGKSKEELIKILSQML